jgi:hypothetical protein
VSSSPISFVWEVRASRHRRGRTLLVCEYRRRYSLANRQPDGTYGTSGPGCINTEPFSTERQEDTEDNTDNNTGQYGGQYGTRRGQNDCTTTFNGSTVDEGRNGGRQSTATVDEVPSSRTEYRRVGQSTVESKPSCTDRHVLGG